VTHPTLLLLVGALLLTGAAMAKRVGPPEVKPLTVGGVTYRAGHTADSRGNRGTVEAVDATTGKRRWLVTVYDVPYRPGLETDVQDVFIKSLEVEGTCLRVTDERGVVRCVDLETGAVKPVLPLPEAGSEKR